MARRMLIDASHPEETRVVVVDGTRLEDFDYEMASRKPLKGNIYLAKVIRIEPSLQAAFVEYGGNRHGFLAFSEIHPDYYQIPIADRQRLLEPDWFEQPGMLGVRLARAHPERIAHLLNDLHTRALANGLKEPLALPITQEHIGADGGPITLASVNLKGLSDDELQKMQQLLSKAVDSP